MSSLINHVRVPSEAMPRWFVGPRGGSALTSSRAQDHVTVRLLLSLTVLLLCCKMVLS